MFLCIIERPPMDTRIDTLVPYTTRFGVDDPAGRRPSLGGLRVGPARAHREASRPRRRADPGRRRRPLRRAVRARPGAAASHRLARSEEHTSELQSLMRTSYAVFCLKKKTKSTIPQTK